MELSLTDTAKEDVRFFLKSGQTGILKKIEKLLFAIQQSPFTGIGKPEPLKHEYMGKWLRRIDLEHRIIYSLNNGIITIYSLKGHYNNIIFKN